MKAFLLITTTLLIISGCKKDPSKKVLEDFDGFMMEIPVTWTHKRKQGIDSQVGDIDLGQQEMVSYDLGRYSSSLNEDTSTHFFQFLTIDNREVKIVKPKKSRQGLTGAHFPSINGGRTSLVIYGRNLSASNENLFLKAIRTITFSN